MRLVCSELLTLVHRHYNITLVPVLDNIQSVDYRKREQRNYDYFESIADRLPYVQGIDLRHLSTFGNDMLETSVLMNLPSSLHKIYIPDNINVDIDNAIRYIPMVEILEVGLLSDVGIANIPRTVVNLTFDGSSSKLTEAGLFKLSKNISTFQLKNCRKPQIVNCCLKHLENVIDLTLYRCALDDTTSDLFQFLELFELKIFKCTGVDYIRVSNIKNLDKLTTTIPIEHGGKMFPFSMRYLEAPLTNDNMKMLPLNIKKLHLLPSEEDRDQLQNIPDIIELSIVKNTALTDDCLLFLPECLQTLIIKQCHNITGSFLQTCPINLVKLHFIGCQSLNSEYLPYISHNLQDVEISNCTYITGVGINLMFPKMKNLTSLNLSHTSVRSPALFQLKDCDNLTSLNLSNTAITDYLIPSLPRNLKYLYLDNCNITEIGLADLPPNIHTLSLANCNRFIGEMIKLLPRNVHILDISGELMHIKRDLIYLPPVRVLRVIIPAEEQFQLSDIKESVFAGIIEETCE
eukprot:TRINITY_DN5618_c0_g2_i1.p1 TRINITY_DN5618_c0_g2~~TRINITY_DN5618_c0_g2_i1.p1  ORF type:complete len:549 (-),score=91.15 TRINITY_DN5618_c0_g2_i1:4-1557(-)